MYDLKMLLPALFLPGLVFACSFMIQALLWRAVKPKNSFQSVFLIYALGGVVCSFLLWSPLNPVTQMNLVGLLIYSLISAAWINTWPAIEADSVTFVIQKKISIGRNTRELLYSEFDYSNQIGKRVDQLIKNKLVSLGEDEKLDLTRGGRRLARTFLFLSKIYRLKKGG